MPDAVLRLAVVAGVVLAAAVFGWWWDRRTSRVRTSGDGRFAPAELASVGLDRDDVAVRALLLGSPTCAPCRTVKRVLAEVSEVRPGFAWVEVDAGEHLELTREHHVMRVPTLFVIDRDGRIVARTSGVPATGELLAILDRTG